MTSPASVSPGRRFLGRADAAVAVLVLVAGGMVTSTASGLAVPDWPLSYGSWLPTMSGGIFYEHGHRMIAAFLGLLILVMAVWTQLEETRPGVRRLAWWTLAAVCAQGALGGITVWFGLPTLTSAAHATLAQTLFCLVVVMADLTGEDGGARPLSPAGSLGRHGIVAAAALWTQLVLGAILRHGGASVVWHLAGAAVAALAAGSFGARVILERREPDLVRPGATLLILLGLQLALGTATADFRLQPFPRANYAMIAVATIHLAVGALLLGTTVLAAFRLYRLRAD